jgi:hypothetical protein
MKTIIHNTLSSLGLILLGCMTTSTTFAQSNVLSIHRKDGKKIQYSFLDYPQIMFDNEYLMVKTKNIETQYPLDLIEKYTINESEDPLSLKDILVNNDTINSFYNATDIQNCNITYKRTFDDTEWQTLYVPFCIKYSLLQENFEIAVINNFHQYDDDNNGKFDRTELEIKKVTEECTLMANYPYLIKAKTEGTKHIYLPETVLQATEDYAIDCSSVEWKYTFTGTYNRINNLRSKGIYVLENGSLTKAYSSSQYLAPFRWYLSITSRGNQFLEDPIILSANSIRIVEIEDNTTGIKNIKNEALSTILSYEERHKNSIYSIEGNSTSIKQAGLYIIRTNDGSIKKVFINQ